MTSPSFKSEALGIACCCALKVLPGMIWSLGRSARWIDVNEGILTACVYFAGEMGKSCGTCFVGTKGSPRAGAGASVIGKLRDV